MNICPLIAAEGLNFSFPSAEKKQNAAAVSDAMKGSARARLVIAAPAKAKDRLGRDSEWTICGGIEFDFFYQISISNVN